MPDVKWNSSIWDGDYDWAGGGEEWSAAWGGSEAQWFGSLYPRLHRALPARAILEIAPGFGRWTKFLLSACDDFLGIDLSAQCIDACRSRFARAGHATFMQNDGISLSDAPDAGFDLVFSFDSLVHVELEVLEAYVPQILRKLAERGVAFIHHSNLFALPEGTSNPHQRAGSVSAEKVAQLVRSSGGVVLVQELINWGGTDLHDCFTLFGAATAFSGVEPILIQNPRFMAEASIIQECQSPWSGIQIVDRNRISPDNIALDLPPIRSSREGFFERLRNALGHRAKA